jgi:hypothetical protein
MLKINCQEKIDSHSVWFDLLKFEQCQKSRKTVETVNIHLAFETLLRLGIDRHFFCLNMFIFVLKE